jgi:hypothetical protein
MDAKRSKTRVAVPNTYAPKKASIRGEQNERMVDKRDEYLSRLSSFCSGAAAAYEQYRRGKPEIEGMHEPNPKKFEELLNRCGSEYLWEREIVRGYFVLDPTNCPIFPSSIKSS